MWLEEPPPNYRYRGFHKTGYQEPAASLPVDGAVTDAGKNHRHISHFTGPGVERHSQAEGFAYGSVAEYDSSKRRTYRGRYDILDDRRSTERMALKRQQKEAEKDIETHQELKTRRAQEEAEEKRKDLEMLQNYKPWGKPAVGAPRMTPSGALDTRRQKIDFDNEVERPAYNPFGRPGAGAPLKSNSGKVQALLKADPNLRFQDQLKKEVDHSLRYRPDESRDGKIHHGALQKSDSEKLRLSVERDKKLNYAKRLEEQRIEARERRARERAEDNAPTSEYMWGKNVVGRDDSGKIKGHRWLLDRDPEGAELDGESRKYYAGIAVHMGRQGAGAPLRDENGKVIARVSNTNVATGKEDEYNPWDKPGGGAPLKTNSGKMKTNVIGKYSNELERHSAHKRVDVDKSEASRGHGIDTASWMRSGVIGGLPKRDSATGQIVGVNKSTSDITANRYDIRPRHHLQQKENKQEYFTALQHQANKRHEQLMWQKRADIELESQHMKKMDTTWEDTNERAPQPKRYHHHFGGDVQDEGSVVKKRQYCNDLQKMIDERHEQRRQLKVSDIHNEKQHIAAFNQQWGRPGAGAPRLNERGQVETVPKNIGSMLETHVYTGWHFRRT